MGPESESPRQRSAVRGLATVALLKSNYDQGRDHIDLFQPFLLDTVAHRKADDFSLQDIRQELDARHHIQVPTHSLGVLLSRACNAKYLRREGGRYFRTPAVGTVKNRNIATDREQIEQRQRNLANALIEFAGRKKVTIESAEDALALIYKLLERNQVRLALSQTLGTENPSATEEPPSRRTEYLVAQFVADVVVPDAVLAPILQEILEGFVFQNALFLRDISAAGRKFNNLEVFLDTGILLGVLGFRGAAAEQAACEGIELVRASGATLSAFDKTMAEIRRILLVYENMLGTQQGRERLIPSDVTRHFLAKRYTPADVKGMAALLEQNLREKHVSVRQTPTRVAEFTFGEADLAKALARESSTDTEPRIVHDVDCIAGILTLRKRHRTDVIEDARAIFVTTSFLTVRSIIGWYRQQGGTGVAPIIHQFALTNIAWLKRPAAAPKLQLHELTALCAATLRPNRKLWDAFVKHLRKLEQSGEITSDEAAAIVASDLVDRALIEASERATDPDDPDAITLSEVVDRVKREYFAEADKRVARANAAAIASHQREQSTRAAAERVARIIGSVSWWIAFVCVALPAVVTAGWYSVMSLAGALPSSWLEWAAIVFAVFVGALGLLFGGSIWSSKEWVERKIAKAAMRLFERPG